MLRAIGTVAFVLFLTLSLGGQRLNNTTLQDDLLDRFVGHWDLTGTLNGNPTKQSMDSEWVLNHQFLCISQKESANGRRPFEALFYIGYDNAQSQYVVHLLTVFGGSNSPDGTGTKKGNELRFSFKRPTGEIAYRFIAGPDPRTWRILATNAGKPFLDLTATRRAE